MGRPRMSIARMMAVVVIAALDSGLLRLSFLGDLGLLAIGLAVSAGLIGWLFLHGRARRFAGGFVVTGLVAAGAFYAGLVLVPGVFEFIADGYIEPLLDRMPFPLTDHSWCLVVATPVDTQGGEPVVTYPSVPALIIVDALIGLPWLILASTGGYLWMRVCRRDQRPAPEPS